MRDARPPPGEGTARPRPRAVGGMERGAPVACTLLLAFAACLVPASGQGKRLPGGALLGAPDFPGGGRRAEGSEAGGGGWWGVGGRTGRRLPPGRSGCPVRGEREPPSVARFATEQPQT